MSTLYPTEPRSLVRREADDLVVLIPNPSVGNGRRVEVPFMKIDQAVVQGDVTVTSPELHALLEARIEASFLSHHGQYRVRLSPGPSRAALLRVAQHRAHDDAETRHVLARQVVRGKLTNMRTMTLRQDRKLQEYGVGQAAVRLKAAIGNLDSADFVASLAGSPE